MLEVRGVSKSFAENSALQNYIRKACGRNALERKILDNVSLKVDKSEIVGLVGPSGCGKTTLAHIICGFDQNYTGKISINGKVMCGRSIHNDLFRCQVQLIFQNSLSSLDPLRSVYDQIAEAPLYHNIISRQNKKSYVLECMDRAKIERRFLYRYPAELSGGQVQRVTIARALAVQPKILICDEPTSFLDSSTKGQILELLFDLKKEQGLSILFVSHEIKAIINICSRVYTISNCNISQISAL